MNYSGFIGLVELARKYELFPNPTLGALLTVSLFFPEFEEDAAEYINFKIADRISHGYRAKF